MISDNFKQLIASGLLLMLITIVLVVLPDMQSIQAGGSETAVPDILQPVSTEDEDYERYSKVNTALVPARNGDSENASCSNNYSYGISRSLHFSTKKRELNRHELRTSFASSLDESSIGESR